MSVLFLMAIPTIRQMFALSVKTVARSSLMPNSIPYLREKRIRATSIRSSGYFFAWKIKC